MKILFLCSSVEAGKDGVGDYTKLLGSVLVLKGYQVHILALCDSHVEGIVKETKNVENSSCTITRISGKTSQNERFLRVQEVVNEFGPDWVSLQFVPYGYNAKGLPFWLPGFLDQLKGVQQWHIMFHELWMGTAKKGAFKNKVVSYFQKHIIKQLLKKINPKLIHTHLPAYRSNIEKLGYRVKALPLFSNISPISAGVLENKPLSTFRWAFFSQVEIEISIIDFINSFNIALKEKGIVTELIFIGGNKSRMLPYVEYFKNHCPLLITVSCTGFLNETEISDLVTSCDMGITPVPQHALGKSGSAATFLAHGIPVAAPIVNQEYTDSGIGFFDDNWSKAILTNPSLNALHAAQKAAFQHKQLFTVEYTSISFMNDLVEITKTST
ncbi:glycosyltransferase [Flavobacterium sp. Arc3]|uniref:hypothetical protein n=1 Tax=unclassified Flavobacterium TaxID=196869 RepID=UPI00352E02EA